MLGGGEEGGTRHCGFPRHVRTDHIFIRDRGKDVTVNISLPVSAVRGVRINLISLRTLQILTLGEGMFITDGM